MSERGLTVASMPSVSVKVVIGAVVDQRHVAAAAEALGHHAGDDVDLVVIGQRDQRVGLLDVGLALDVLIERVAVQDDRALERVGDRDRALPCWTR